MGHSQEDAAPGDALSNVFVISSGLMNTYGIFSQDQKFTQLIQSIRSVRVHMPESKICVIDCSASPIPEAYVTHLMYKELVDFYQLLLNPDILQCSHTDSNQFVPKTIGEIAIVNYFLDSILPNYSNVSRVHKLSGRYQINKTYSTHGFFGCNIMVGPLRYSQLTSQSTEFTEGTICTKVWNFSMQLYPHMHRIWNDIAEKSRMLWVQNQSIITVEAQLHTFIQKYKIPCVHVNPIGVLGYYGQDGAFVIE